MAHTPPPAELPIYEIAPATTWVPVRLGEIWAYRELLYFLVWREIRVRYKQTALGIAWAVVQPFFTMAVFSVFFGRLGGIDTGGIPYPVFVFTALLPWQLFAFSLTEASNSVVSNQRLLTKVYFPRVILPLASVSVGLTDFSIALGILVLLMTWYGVVPGLAMLTVPLWALLAMASALSVSLWLSALNVRYRDIRYTVPFLTQLWLLSTPVAYPSTWVKEEWRVLYALNPMVGVVDGFRWAIVGGPAPGVTVVVSSLVVAGVLVSGLVYFRRTERTFADTV